MDRPENHRFALLCWLVAIMFACTDFAIANSTDSSNPGNSTKNHQNSVQSKTTFKATNEVDNKPNVTNTSTSMDGLFASFPQLERALVIVTIVNLFVIIFAILFYLVKRRMNQFSPTSLASLGQNQN